MKSMIVATTTHESARLNAGQWNPGNSSISTKSVTAERVTRSMRLPMAPPPIRPTQAASSFVIMYP
jgi:hypothetical protein